MDKISECILNKDPSFVPIWFMRQAGRYLPEFREIRKNNQDFIKLCLNRDLVKEITLQPINRFNLDAAIIFSDILMIPYGLGQEVKFKKNFGPILGDLIIEDILSIDLEEFIKKNTPVYKAITEVKKKINHQSLIGFVGAPWTLLVYMMNKQSPKKDFDLSLIKNNKNECIKLLRKIEEATCLHIEMQIKAGANIIQIFDSWAGLLPKDMLDEFCFEPNSRLTEYLKEKKTPAICFPRGIGKEYSNFCQKVKPTCINIDYDVDPNWAKENFNGIPIQGGMDPKILIEDKSTIKKETENYLNIFKNYPYIFNLGHGVLPETKPETISYVIKVIREKK